MKLIDLDRLSIGLKNIEVFENKDYAKGWNDAIKCIMMEPVIEVVRCKDCVHYQWICGGYCKRCENDTVYPMPTNSDGFCCYGEKK